MPSHKQHNCLCLAKTIATFNFTPLTACDHCSAVLVSCIIMAGHCYQSSLFQGKKLSFYSGDLPQLYTLLLTSIMSCQVSKRKESKRKKCQKKKEHNARKANQRKVTMLSGWQIARITITNCQPSKNALSQRLSFWLTSFPFHTIRYLSASMSDAFHLFSIAFNSATSAVLFKTFKCLIRSLRIFTRSVNTFCVSFVYIRIAFTLFFKPFRFIIASVICL